jgi:DNA-binding NarL/FixJ family response regulator
MEPIPKILCVSPDPLLLQTRRWILESYFQVDCAGRLPEAAAMAESQNYDLILLCYSLRAEECRQIHSLVRTKTPQTQILALTERNDGCAEAYSDIQMPVGQGPYELLKKVAEMIAPHVSQQIRKKTRRNFSPINVDEKLPPLSVSDEAEFLPSRRTRIS